MVKLIDPLGSTEARGRIGGTVYNTWRGISYARVKVTPANPNTAARLAARALAKLCTKRWQTISDLQRSWWNDYAVEHVLSDWRGKPKRISGFNWFMKANFNRVALSLAIVDTPPVDPAPAAVATLSAVTSGNAIAFSWTLPPGYLASSQQIDIWLSYPMSSGRQPKIEDCKHLAFIPAEDGTYTTPALVPASYGIFARVIHETDGLASPWRLVKHTREAITFAEVGPSYPTIGVSLPPGDAYWLLPINITDLDASLVTVELLESEISESLSGSEFGFSPPAVCSILGVLARVYCAESAPGRLTARLRDSSGPIGSSKILDIPYTADEWLSFGSSSDMWGAALTSAILTQSEFGLDLTYSPSDPGTSICYIDAFELTGYYST